MFGICLGFRDSDLEILYESVGMETIRLIFWFLLERLVRIPSHLISGLHMKLLLKVTKALRAARLKNAEKTE